MKTENDICKCGHKRRDHSAISPYPCYTFKHIKKCHYQCVCEAFR